MFTLVNKVIFLVWETLKGFENIMFFLFSTRVCFANQQRNREKQATRVGICLDEMRVIELSNKNIYFVDGTPTTGDHRESLFNHRSFSFELPLYDLTVPF